MERRTRILALSPIALAALLLGGCSNDGDDNAQSTSSSTGSTSASVSTDDTGTDSTDTSTSTETTEGESGGDCYVHLFDSEDFDEGDDNFKLIEPGRYEDLKNLPGADDDWTDEADSLKVGAGATVTIWEKTNFEGQSQKFDPGSEHPKVDPEPSSLEMAC